MKLLANEEGGPGIAVAVAALQDQASGMDAIVQGITAVEHSTEARSVGFGGWPNLLGEMEFDASVMDGDSLDSGAVGALQGTISAVAVARQVMEQSPHQILVGDGARRFAEDAGFEPEETLYEDSRRRWHETLRATLSADQFAAFPDIKLFTLPVIAANPEQVRDTTVYLCRDRNKTISTASSTSGWGWKHPGRLGDAPICGAGFYADSEYGAAACTHTGEMAIRAGTAHTVVSALKAGASVEAAAKVAIGDLKRLKTGFLGGVVIHMLDAHEDHLVVNFRCEEQIRYWMWSPELEAVQLCDADIVVE
ncbi:MAG: isoaspartyl peptidase/L-asparaginase [Woeseiaceae bacterium]